jgi:hypothetical protein
MIFQFSHGGNVCTAYVIYEPAQVRDTMIVYPVDFVEELGREIFFFEYEPLKWKTNAKVKTDYRDTYRDLCARLEEIFLDYKFRFVQQLAEHT